MYFNTVSQVVSAAGAATSFTTDITINNFDNGSVQVVWAGIDGVASTFKLQGSINGTDFSDVSAGATTMNTAASSVLYDITHAGYQWLRCVYVAATSTTGTINVWVEKKSNR